MGDARRDFILPDEDIQFLDAEYPGWEAIQEGNSRAVILYGFPFPEVFQPQATNLKIKIPNDYIGGAALDMFFTDVQTKRSDGVDISRLTEASVFDGKKWWQWSRHYPKSAKWRPGVNTLVTHITYVAHVLQEEGDGKSWE